MNAVGEASGIDRFVVSSEDLEILQIAREISPGAPLPRPAELAQDDSSSVDVVLHALDAVGGGFDRVVLLQPTSPLRTAADIDGCLDLLETSGAPACVSVTRPRHHPGWTYSLDAQGCLQALFPVPEGVHRRQQLEPVVALNGAVYVARLPWFREARSFLVPETVGYEMPAERSIDIDDQLDFRIAEVILGDAISSKSG
jgi:N-acylneuraminate cytidylyltransferase